MGVNSHRHIGDKSIAVTNAGNTVHVNGGDCVNRDKDDDGVMRRNLAPDTSVAI